MKKIEFFLDLEKIEKLATNEEKDDGLDGNDLSAYSNSSLRSPIQSEKLVFGKFEKNVFDGEMDGNEGFITFGEDILPPNHQRVPKNFIFFIKI